MTATLPDPVKRYRRVVDRLECPICGKRLGERGWDQGKGDWSDLAYIDSGPTYYRDELRGPKVRTFKPCGCEAWEVPDVPEGNDPSTDPDAGQNRQMFPGVAS